MKLLRFGALGAEKPGLLSADGVVRDLSGYIKDITGDTLSDASLEKLKALDPASLPAAPKGERLGPPVANVRSFVGIGFNYTDHAKDAGAPIPAEPIVFLKSANCMCGPNDDVMIPRGSSKLDWEVELAFVVGKRAQYVDLKDATGYIAGYTICNEVSERVFQFERSASQWTKGKCAEELAPRGPWLVTGD
jgi:2,4-diketo-3-deoxy-L-fuconate hydrolase